MGNHGTETPTKQEILGTPFNPNSQRSIIYKATKGRRHIIAARMTKILGREVTPAMFGDFCRKAPGKRHTRFPAEWVRAFCEAVGNDELARSLLTDSARRALSFGEFILPLVLEQAQVKVAKLTKDSRRLKR